MKIKATCVVNNTGFVGEGDASDLQPGDYTGVIAAAVETAMNAARDAGHDDLSAYTVAITFTPPAAVNESDEPAEAE